MEVLDETTGDRARCLQRQLLLPVSMISPLVGQAIDHIGQAAAIFGAFCLRKLSPLSCRR